MSLDAADYGMARWSQMSASPFDYLFYTLAKKVMSQIYQSQFLLFGRLANQGTLGPFVCVERGPFELVKHQVCPLN
jgi:hypothetical protein